MTLHPQAQVVVDLVNAGEPVPLEAHAATEVWAAAIVAGVGEPPTLVAIDDVELGGVPVRLYRPGGGDRPLLVYFHGGGYTIGSVASHDPVTRVLAAASGCTVASVDYRRAWQDPFPAALDDAWAVTRALGDDPGALGLAPPAIATIGDSAGGGLATLVALLARDAGAPHIDASVLVYPWVDLVDDRPSMSEHEEGFVLDRRTLDWFAASYLAGAPADDWRASPLRHDDLAGLPPTFVLTAEHDPLRDQGEAYAAALAAAGVEVRQRRYEGMFHPFFAMVAILDGARAAMDDCVDFLRVTIGAPVAG